MWVHRNGLASEHDSVASQAGLYTIDNLITASIFFLLFSAMRTNYSRKTFFFSVILVDQSTLY